jgi:hypothetical protein
MGKRKKQSSHEYNHSPSTVLMAMFCAVCAFLAVETTFPDAFEALGHQMNKIPVWKFHMGSAFVGIMVFFTVLFLLEVLETKSKRAAWLSSARWLPLAGLTGLATVIHIPIYVVLAAGTIIAVWAYHRTSSVRRSSPLP